MRLIFQDAEDLTLVSAQLQDALVRVSDIARSIQHGRFALMVTRFCWDEVKRPLGFLPPVGPFRRVRAGVHFDDVRDVRMQGIDLARPEIVLELLAITFAPGDPPGGTVTLSFAGGATLALTVESVGGGLADQGEPFASARLPRHRA